MKAPPPKLPEETKLQRFAGSAKAMPEVGQTPPPPPPPRHDPRMREEENLVPLCSLFKNQPLDNDGQSFELKGADSYEHYLEYAERVCE